MDRNDVTSLEGVFVYGQEWCYVARWGVESTHTEKVTPPKLLVMAFYQYCWRKSLGAVTPEEFLKEICHAVLSAYKLKSQLLLCRKRLFSRYDAHETTRLVVGREPSS